MKKNIQQQLIKRTRLHSRQNALGAINRNINQEDIINYEFVNTYKMDSKYIKQNLKNSEISVSPIN